MEESDIYFSTLQSLRAHATKLRKKDEAEEKRLMEYLSVNERIELERENKVLTKWQERQRDWERIEQRISKKLNSKIARPLMMTVTDEYRSKMEEYDLIQAAIPLKDRYAESSWQMTLRGGGPITVAIGHIFSGLECEIDPHVPKPKMVRKPKPSTAVWKNDTFLEESENLTMKRKKYEKSIKEIRPHTLTYRDAGQLVIRSMDLFQWAEESSLEYVKQQREEELARLEEEMQAMRSLESSQEQEEEITSPDHPQLTFLSSPEVVLDTQLGKQAHRTVSFKNTGPVVLYYRWKRLHNTGSSHDANKGSAKTKSLEAVHHDKGGDDAALRAFTLEQNREKFFCLNDSGEVLPGETVTTDFVFDSDVGGVYRSSWILQFVPEETKISLDEGINEEKQGVQFEDQRSERDGSQVGHTKPVTGCITIALRGHCAVPDESMTNRSLLASHISYQTEVTEIQDIIYSCVRRVRSPVRMADLQARQRDLFADYNESVYHAYFPKATKRVLAPWKLTNDRVNRLEQLQHEVGHLYDRLHDRFELTWREVCEPSSDVVAKAVPMPDLPSSLEWRNETLVTGEERQRVLTALFPEETIDIFDEVTPEDIEPHWNYRVGTALTTLQTLATAADFLAVMEDVLLRRAVKQAKLDAKLARRAAKKAAGDSDEEDDDDEDEEEDEDDDEMKRKQRKPQHLLAIEVQSLRDAIEGELVALQTTLTYSVDTVFALTKNALCEAIDDICDMQQRALQAANLMELVNHTLGPAAQTSGEGFTGFVNPAVIAPLQNPFLSEEGAKTFETLVALTSPDPPVDPNAPPVKGKAKEAAGKKGKEVAPPPATPLQVDFYHKVFYDALRSRLIDSIVHKVDIPPPTVSLLPDEENTTATEAAENAATKLAQAAVWRGEDVRNKVVFFTFDLAQRVDTSDEHEAAVGIGFDAVGRKIQTVAEEVAAMILEGQPACLLLLSSSCASPESVWQQRATELGQRLQYQWAKSVLQYRKRMKRAKQTIESGHVSNKVLQVWNHVDSWAALMYELLPQVLRPPRAPLSTTVPIFIVPDLTMPRLVPAVPPYEWIEDEDDDPAVAIGGDEYAAQHYERYLAAYPMRLPVVTNGAAGAGAAASGQRRASWQRRASVKRQENEPPSCFCDISAALVDLTQYVCAQFYEDNPQAVQWVDGTTQHVFQPQLPLHKIHDASYKKVLPRDPVVLAQMKLARESVLCSRRVRESIVWSLLPRMVLPGWASIVSTAATDETEAAGGARSALTEHIRHLFPSAIAEQRRPRTLFVLGGAMRAEKLRLLDELIALFPQIYLVGEVAVRFLGIQAASSSSSESGVGERAGRFQTMCRKLLAKARVMGCELILPTDFVVGDEPQRLAAVQAKLFQHDASIAAPLPPPLAGMESSWVPPSSSSVPSTQQQAEVSAAGLSRSDAADYDGDARVVSAAELLSLSLPVPLPPYPPTPEEVAAREEAKKQMKRAGGGGATPVTPDAVYDIGPASQQRLREAVEASELTYIYGPAGFVELSAFQGGHNALVQALSSIFAKENAAAEARRTERKDAAKAAGKGSIAATQAAWEALQPVWLERNQHVVLLGEETVDWFARSLDPDADFRGDLVASGHVSFIEANAAFFLGHMVLTETPVNSPPTARGRSDERRRQALLEDNLVRRPPTEREFVYSRARNLEEDEDEEEDDEDEEEEED